MSGKRILAQGKARFLVVLICAHLRPSVVVMNWYALAVLAGYWLVVIRHLHVEWVVNPQYSYGWAVPLLCAYLFFKRWPARPPTAEVPAGRWPLLWATLLALLFLPTCLAEAANPEWRVASWLFSLEAIGLSLCALWLFRGWSWVRHFWFPLAFFLVAVPWLRPIQDPIIDGLTRGNASATVEVLGVLGIPALQRGNLIEVATGVIGIDEACSGIRCFQATLMLSLFFGELFGLTVFRRTALCLLGFAFSFLFNVVRTTLLTSVAAKKGIAAVASWHDPAGVTILVACFICLWLVARGLKGKAEMLKASVQKTEARGQRSVVSGPGFSFSAFQYFSIYLGAWLVLVEVGTEAWYRIHARPPNGALNWSVYWPTGNASFRESPMPEKVVAFLRFDEGHSVVWQDMDSSRWQMFYFRWLPGRVSDQLVGDHNPSICLPASGRELLSVSETEPIPVHGLQFRFRCYYFVENQLPAFVFYTVWEDGTSAQRLPPQHATAADRLRAVMRGRRNPGQRVLEIAVWGINDAQEAQAALQRQLEHLIKVQE